MQEPAEGRHRDVQRTRRGRRRRGAAGKVGVALALVALAVVGAACSGGPGGGTTITLYNGQHEQTTDALVQAFERQTGIHVSVRNDDESVLVNQIETEGSGSPADVIYTENSLGLEQLQEKHMLAAVDPVTLAAVPARYSSPTGHWVGVSARVSVMIYNTGQLSADELPKSVMDLALPAWKGKLGLAEGEVDFFPIVASIIDAHGRAAAAAWLAGVKANAGGNVYPDNETLINEVNQGHIGIGIINHYYWYRQRAEVGAVATHSAIATFAPGDPGYIIDVSGAGVLASSQEQAAAQRFVAFLVGRQGQEILAHSQSFEYPLGSGVTTAQPLQPFDTLQPSPLTVGELGDGAAAIGLLQQAGLA
ncbi:MAG: extracellular solute-binding protein [Acidimicrobiales bacterium]